MSEVIKGTTFPTKQSERIIEEAQSVVDRLCYIYKFTVQDDVRDECKKMIYFLSSKYPIRGYCGKCDNIPNDHVNYREPSNAKV